MGNHGHYRILQVVQCCRMEKARVGMASEEGGGQHGHVTEGRSSPAKDGTFS